MLKGINQNTNSLLYEINKFGCLFLCFAEKSSLVFEGKSGSLLLNYLWQDAKNKGVISSDSTVQSHSALAEMFQLKIRYDDIHHDDSEIIPDSVTFVIGEFFWKSSHFVILDKDKQVIFDPLGNSNTVKNGTLKSMRWYYAI